MPSPEAGEQHQALFIVAASARLARTRAERTVIQGLGALRGPSVPGAVDFASRNLQEDGRLHAWSIRDSPPLVKTWARLGPGDWVLFYQMGFFTIAAKVSETIESADLASGMWGADNADELRFVVAFDETWPIWAKVWPFREEIGARFLGFRRAAEERQEALRKHYGSVEALIRRQMIPQKRPSRNPQRTQGR